MAKTVILVDINLGQIKYAKLLKEKRCEELKELYGVKPYTLCKEYSKLANFLKYPNIYLVKTDVFNLPNCENSRKFIKEI